MLVAVLLSAVCSFAPVSSPVADPYRPPDCPWCPGNRGVEYATVPGVVVRSVVAGVVTFAGEVAGQRYVTVRISDGRLVTYGRLVETFVDHDHRVVRGQRIGLADADFILTLRRDGQYEDPASVLTGERPPRLVRLDGARRPPSSTRCRAEIRWGSAATVR